VRIFTQVFLVLIVSTSAWPQTNSTTVQESAYRKSLALYFDLHQNPELSTHEIQTAAKLAARLRELGYDVTEHVGGTGIVALLKNGSGPTIMLRTELDALPVEEQTGLPYASKVQSKDESGQDVFVSHVCGHDLHMAALIATADIMIHTKTSWHGTLMLIGQPAEETNSGARTMINDGLFTRFPKPDAALALHVVNLLKANRRPKRSVR
jgi:amidohydrolase